MITTRAPDGAKKIFLEIYNDAFTFTVQSSSSSKWMSPPKSPVKQRCILKRACRLDSLGVPDLGKIPTFSRFFVVGVPKWPCLGCIISLVKGEQSIWVANGHF